MFIFKKDLEKALRGIINEGDSTSSLKLQITGLKEELEDLKLKKKMEETEIKHLVKMKEEKQALEVDKAKNDLNKTFNEKEMALQTKYHDKVMGVIQGEHLKIQELYKEILTRLPNVNMTIAKKG
jgi:hypothetical protein